MAENFQIRRLTPADAIGLGGFFKTIALDAESTRFFHPHPFNQDTATYLAWHSQGKRDRYFVADYCGRIVGYSMLRGWDEGFDIPSWGGCVLPQIRNARLGQCLLAHGIRESQAAGAAKLRLTVYKDNHRAVHVYRKFGFVYKDKNERELIGMLDLTTVKDLQAVQPNDEPMRAWLNQGNLSRLAA